MFDPSTRHNARGRALQFLFGLDFTQYDWEESLEPFWRVKTAKAGVKAYTEQLVRGISQNREALDQEIAQAVQNWTPDRVGYIERNIIRIALYEMRFATDVPIPVAINEAVELAKEYGSDDAPRFVNGVLDRLKVKRPIEVPEPEEPTDTDNDTDGEADTDNGTDEHTDIDAESE